MSNHWSLCCCCIYIFSLIMSKNSIILSSILSSCRTVRGSIFPLSILSFYKIVGRLIPTDSVYISSLTMPKNSIFLPDKMLSFMIEGFIYMSSSTVRDSLLSLCELLSRCIISYCTTVKSSLFPLGAVSCDITVRLLISTSSIYISSLTVPRSSIYLLSKMLFFTTVDFVYMSSLTVTGTIFTPCLV